MSAREGKLSRRERLEAELEAAIAQIDEEGLVFLLEQANVLLHNARVEELARERQTESSTPSRSRQADRGPGPTAGVEESADRKTFFLVLGRTRKVLSVAEMRQIVKVCHSADSVAEGADRLYRHLGRERKDILLDAGIASPRETLLSSLVEEIRSRYRPREA